MNKDSSINRSHELKDHIIFYKKQIIYYQSLLQNSIEFQYKQFSDDIGASDASVPNASVPILKNIVPEFNSLSDEDDKNKIKQKMKRLKENVASVLKKSLNIGASDASGYIHCSNHYAEVPVVPVDIPTAPNASVPILAPVSSPDTRMQLKDKFLQEQEDIRKLKIKQFDARKYLQENEESINKIRAMEEKLIKDGKKPEEARIETRKRLYPESIPKINKDGSTNRSHELLILNDSDSDSDSDSDASVPAENNLLSKGDTPYTLRQQKQARTCNKNIVEKINELFENEDPFDIIEIGDNVNPDDIEEEVELASFEN